MLGIALTIWGIVILVKRRVSLTRSKICVGTPAIMVGLLFISIFPVTLLLGIGLGIYFASTGQGMEGLQAIAIFIDLGVLALIVVSGLTIAAIYGKSEEELENRRGRPPVGNPHSTPPVQDSNNPYQTPHV